MVVATLQVLKFEFQKFRILEIFTNVVLFQQTDVAGNCDTSYTTGEDGWYSKTIKKTKNLLSCTERNGYRTSIQGIPYAADSVSHLGLGFLTIMNG